MKGVSRPSFNRKTQRSPRGLLSDMASSYCTVHVGNLPDGVTDEQLCGRFKRAVPDREVIRTAVVCKAGKTFGFIVFRLSGDQTHGEQYLERQSIVAKCHSLYHNTSWQGSKITVAEGREHYAVRLEREKLETKLDSQNQVRANKILELNLNAPMPSTDDNLLLKAKWGKGFISVSRTPMPWSYNGSEPVARLRAYNSDSEDELEKGEEKEHALAGDASQTDEDDASSSDSSSSSGISSNNSSIENDGDNESENVHNVKKKKIGTDSDEEYPTNENRNGIYAAVNFNGADGSSEEKRLYLEESSTTASVYENIDKMEQNDGKRKMDDFYDDKEKPLTEDNVIRQVKKSRRTSNVFSDDEANVNSLPLYKLWHTSESPRVGPKVTVGAGEPQQKNKDVINNYSEEEWDSDASSDDESSSSDDESSSSDDDNVNQDTLATGERLEPHFDTMEETDKKIDMSVSKERYKMEQSVRNEDINPEDDIFHHRMIFHREKPNVTESEVEDEATTKNGEEQEDDEERMNLERSDALAIFDKLCKPDDSTETKTQRDTKMVPLGQYATINTDARYNPLAKDAHKFEIGAKPSTKAMPADNNESAEDKSSKSENLEVDDTAGTAANSADDQKATAPERSFWTSKTNYWTSMFNDAAEKNKQGANTNTSASASFSVSSLFSVKPGDTTLDDASGFAGGGSVSSNKNDGANLTVADNSVLFGTISSGVNVERQRNLEFLGKIKERIRPFYRENSLDEINEKWKDDRRELTLTFKRKYKVAMKIARKNDRNDICVYNNIKGKHRNIVLVT